MERICRRDWIKFLFRDSNSADPEQDYNLDLNQDYNLDHNLDLIQDYNLDYSLNNLDYLGPLLVLILGVFIVTLHPLFLLFTCLRRVC